MQDLKSILEAAAGDGVISSEQAGRLEPYLQQRGVRWAGSPERATVASTAGGLSAPRHGLLDDQVTDTEAPRFIRGFHDVLITIGIVVAMAGIWGVGSYFAALPAILILAEILVRRQRLALPAVALTMALVQWIAIVTAIALSAYGDDLKDTTGLVLYALPFPLLLAPFYWRYRIPLALSLLFLSLFGLALLCVFLVLSLATGDADFLIHHKLASCLLFLLAALGLFVLAMRFDLADPERLTRRSDVAFWLHLAAAPALLYAMLSFIFLDNLHGLSLFDGGTGASDAVAVVAIVILFMAIGLVIDRRAFVTSGLLSLGLAIASILQKTEARVESYAFVTLLIVGLVVLVIGVGWPSFRRFALKLLPEPLKAKLPPLR